ncbi:hypothetical protein EDD15DRAFT_2199208 [Pisolithus albus]|nr:hypothetical protein EDD15DRAFT_2203769 [Pisolithus albus]KAI5981763.1 hypothetical protein EDD15DRAFT_2203642 [Pisolithus albus]KAI5988035.1 hypothetical protein EDD15DRAFT_2199208 [Pisolithus albus]
MPAAQKRRRVRAWKAKMGEKPTEVEIEDSLGLRRGIGPVIDTDSRVEPIAFYGAAKVHCGQATTVTGVNRTESTVVKTKCYYRCFQRKGVWDSGVFPPVSTGPALTLTSWLIRWIRHLIWHGETAFDYGFLFSLPSALQVKASAAFEPDYYTQPALGSSQLYLKSSAWYRRREEFFTECYDLWMRNVGETVDVFENIRLLKLCSRRLQTAHRYQDFKDRAVAIVESLGQEAIRGSTPIAVHGVQLSPPATPAVPHFSRGYDPKRLLIVLQSPYEPVKASISSKSSKGRKGSMNQGWIQRRVFYYPSTSGTCIRREICPTGRL